MEDRSSHNPSDDLVPLDILRPSREHFGPVTTPSKQVQKQANSKVPAKRPAQRQPSKGQASKKVTDNTPALRRGAPPSGARPVQGRVVNQNRQPAKPKQLADPGRRPSGHNGEFANRLAADNRLPVTVIPQSGWRGLVAKATGGTIKLGLSSTEQTEVKFRRQVRRPVTGGTVAVFSRKGGVGKTTISAYLGLTLAAERGGRIVAVDGDAEAGSLGWLLAPDAPSTLASLAAAEPMPGDYETLRGYTTRTPAGLDVIVGDPAEMVPVSTTGLEVVASQLARHYDLSIFDTGAGVTRATGRVLVNSARTLILVMGPSIDSVRAAERTLAWLDERPGAIHPDARIVAVINGIPTSTKKAHVDRIASHFSDRAAAVVRIPWDAHLAAGSATVSLEHLAKPTRKAFLELAAVTVGTLAAPTRRPGYKGARHAS